MATNTFNNGSANLLWNDAGNWSLGHVPTDTEDVALGGFVVAINCARIPAAANSRLGTITSAGTAGQLTLDLNVNGSTGLYATTITPGTIGVGGFIVVIGATANTFTVDVTTLAAGATSSNIGIYFNSTGSIIGTGALLAGTAANGHALVNQTTGTVTWTGPVSSNSNSGRGLKNVSTGSVVVNNGPVTGGSVGIAIENGSTGPISINDCILQGGTGNGTHALISPSVAPTFSNVQLVHSAKATAYYGWLPTWTPAITDYQTWGAVEWVSVTALTAANIRKSIVSGHITGTYAFNINGIDVSGPA